jgi:hypothetical protein
LKEKTEDLKPRLLAKAFECLHQRWARTRRIAHREPTSLAPTRRWSAECRPRRSPGGVGSGLEINILKQKWSLFINLKT